MSRLLDKLSITKQFVLIFLMALAIMASGTGMALLHSYNLHLGAKKKELQDILDTTRTITSYYVAQAQSGAMTTQEAQSKALAAISAIRYDNSNYIFVVGEDGTILSELNPALNGTNQMNLADADGHPVFKPLIEAAMAGQPAYNSYAFPQIAGGPPEPKIALAVEVPQWRWIIGTGVYVTEIRTDMLNYLLGLAEIFTPLLAAYVALAVWVMGRQKDLLNGLSGTMRRLAGGALHGSIPGLQRADEIGDMARAVQVFKENAQEKQRLEAEAQAQSQRLEDERKRNEAEREAAAKELAFVVHELASGLERLSGGDLMIRLNTGFGSGYEKLRQDFNAAMDKLHETMRAIAHNTSGVRSGAGEITQAADDLSRRTEHQAASLEQTAAALDQVTATIRKTAESADGARKTAETAKADAEHSGAVVRETVEAMSGIETSSKQIGNIIGVIDEIAFQTNLLALNAGVEAARAGDAGRGFAVVATEVRSLAQRSADAAKEIKQLISASGQQVETGVRLVGETGKALTRIAEHVAQLNGLVSDIAAAAREQAAGLSEVNSAVNQMDQVTQQNAAMVEQTTAASHGLEKEARELAQLVGQFIIRGAEPVPAMAPKREQVPELA
ncbi:methyl-accepting chemotaxis protein [Acidocella aromatica]|uniref:Methyl-accepting chemotaxis protein n=1 Tax=Acidocella aromatica TaxID=1303579 RepID=A0A840VIT8_9PROT|nr:methyl-accepting chemotaxis protein [Acidocella aromatica]MBB5373095.1 methyl-accepting chemotaxis protein [Acidocella aromatica]